MTEEHADGSLLPDIEEDTVDELMADDDLIGDDDDYLYADESAILQSQLDKLDNISTGVEALLPLFRNLIDGEQKNTCHDAGTSNPHLQSASSTCMFEQKLPLFQKLTDRGLGCMQKNTCHDAGTSNVVSSLIKSETTRAHFPSPRYVRRRVRCGLYTKIMLANFGEIFRRMHRQPEHLIDFVNAEIGEKCVSLEGQHWLVFKQKYASVIGLALGSYTFLCEDELDKMEKEKREKIRDVMMKQRLNDDDIALLEESNMIIVEKFRQLKNARGEPSGYSDEEEFDGGGQGGHTAEEKVDRSLFNNDHVLECIAEEPLEESEEDISDDEYEMAYFIVDEGEVDEHGAPVWYRTNLLSVYV